MTKGGGDLRSRRVGHARLVSPGERSEALDALLVRATESGPWAPSLWPLEVANGLQQGTMRGRITLQQRDAALAALALMPVAIDREAGIQTWTATLGLSTRFDLTVYDAAYLELAMGRSLPLATLDRDLRAAAGAGVPLPGA